jgi:uncharacterized membrane protein
MDAWPLFLLRWLHFLAGITWIGMLYYFNFVQVPFFAGAEAPVRTGMIAGGLVSRALWWFRWGAMITFLTGWLYLLDKIFRQYGGIQPFFSVPYGWSIFFGGIIGSLMWYNVWFIIWPAQQVVMASTARVKEGGQAIPEAAARGARGGVASRTNTLLSIPMLFFMGSASHLAFFTPTALGAKVVMLIVFVIILAIIEGNAVLGAATPDKASAGKKLLSTVKGTLWAGFILTAIFVIALKVVFAA